MPLHPHCEFDISEDSINIRHSVNRWTPKGRPILAITSRCGSGLVMLAATRAKIRELHDAIGAYLREHPEEGAETLPEGWRRINGELSGPMETNVWRSLKDTPEFFLTGPLVRRNLATGRRYSSEQDAFKDAVAMIAKHNGDTVETSAPLPAEDSEKLPDGWEQNEVGTAFGPNDFKVCPSRERPGCFRLARGDSPLDGYHHSLWDAIRAAMALYAPEAAPLPAEACTDTPADGGSDTGEFDTAAIVRNFEPREVAR
jgi:hypothetical protein